MIKKHIPYSLSRKCQDNYYKSNGIFSKFTYHCQSIRLGIYRYDTIRIIYEKKKQYNLYNNSKPQCILSMDFSIKNKFYLKLYQNILFNKCKRKYMNYFDPECDSKNYCIIYNLLAMAQYISSKCSDMPSMTLLLYHCKTHPNISTY